MKIRPPGDTPEPSIEIVACFKKANGDSTWQAVMNIAGVGGRLRTIRAPPRPAEDHARRDGSEMKHAFVDGGMDKLREVQKTQQKGRVH